eukprot:sb/3467426/
MTLNCFHTTSRQQSCPLWMVDNPGNSSRKSTSHRTNSSPARSQLTVMEIPPKLVGYLPVLEEEYLMSIAAIRDLVRAMENKGDAVECETLEELVEKRDKRLRRILAEETSLGRLILCSFLCSISFVASWLLPRRTWLTALPLSRHDFALTNQSEFRDVLRLRYGMQLSKLPENQENKSSIVACSSSIVGAAKYIGKKEQVKFCFIKEQVLSMTLNCFHTTSRQQSCPLWMFKEEYFTHLVEEWSGILGKLEQPHAAYIGSQLTVMEIPPKLVGYLPVLEEEYLMSIAAIRDLLRRRL